MKLDHPIVSILAYSLSAILMTITNKHVITNLEFRLNFLYLSIQSIGCMVFLHILWIVGIIKCKGFNGNDIRKWIWVTIPFIAMLYTMTRALEYLSIAMMTVFKNVTIVLVAYLDYKILKNYQINGLMLVSFGFIIASSLISGYGDFIGKDNGKDSVWYGYFWMACDCIATAAYTIMMKYTLNKVEFNDYDTIYFNNLLPIPILLILSFVSERPEMERMLIEYQKNDSDYNSSINSLIFGIFISTIFTFSISLTTAWCIRVNGPTTYSMIGALNKVPMIISGMLLFDDTVVNVTSICGIGLGIHILDFKTFSDMFRYTL
ncbi:hypothetical protein BC833DRAFT_577914 [Globomyces pollinis-pini]|nr:hypothetical protein BC833DRAFT_577914 [Globomyces pollinis-pini]